MVAARDIQADLIELARRRRPSRQRTRIVELVRAIQQRHGPGRELWFVPLHYHGAPEDPYVRVIGEQVTREVAIMWTGPEVWLRDDRTGPRRGGRRELLRPSLLWVNHRVNDGGMQCDPHRHGPEAAWAEGGGGQRVLAQLDEERPTFLRVADNRVKILARECLLFTDELTVRERGG